MILPPLRSVVRMVRVWRLLLLALKILLQVCLLVLPLNICQRSTTRAMLLRTLQHVPLV